MKNEFLEAGRIVGTHGLKGELRIDPWCDSAEFLKQFKVLYLEKGAKSIQVHTSRVHKHLLLATVEGITTIEEADAARGTVLYIRRDEVKLPKGRYFIADLLGMKVYHADDKSIYYGVITDVIETGANDVYQITGADKKDYLIPVIDSVVITTDVENEELLIRPMKGIFEDAD